MSVQLRLENDRRAYYPGEVIRGSVSWDAIDDPHDPDVHLVCYTEGRGSTNILLARSIKLPLESSGEEKFEFVAPAGPWSYSGAMISLVWAVEVEGLGPATHETIVIGPDAVETRAARVDTPVLKRSFVSTV